MKRGKSIAVVTFNGVQATQLNSGILTGEFSLTDQEKLAERLRALRVLRRLTMAGLATAASLSRTTVSRVLNGHILPSEHVLLSLAMALRAEPGELEVLKGLWAAASKVQRDVPGSAFEERYRDYVVNRYGELTIVGSTCAIQISRGLSTRPT